MVATHQPVATGRVAQKNRTRQRLLSAATHLARTNRAVTLEDAAAAAGMSRATAFRYFTTDSLQLELALTMALDSVDGPVAEVERLCREITDHADRVEAVVRCMARWSWHTQPALRILLRHSLEANYHRPGHRQHWIDLALQPALNDLGPTQTIQLSRALTLLFGVDPLLFLTDLLHLDLDDTLDTLGFAARAMVSAALNTGAAHVQAS
ncbi:MAG: hypothetical protein M3O28_03255 [Actinomycetota bacterium]|nr:hypothetical protein [Actinomycetota bacterium]